MDNLLGLRWCCALVSMCSSAEVGKFSLHAMVTVRCSAIVQNGIVAMHVSQSGKHKDQDFEIFGMPHSKLLSMLAS